MMSKCLAECTIELGVSWCLIEWVRVYQGHVCGPQTK